MIQVPYLRRYGVFHRDSLGRQSGPAVYRARTFESREVWFRGKTLRL